MSDTVLEHPLVREYLRELNAACVALPAAQARELREQITAHLDEALPPDPTEARGPGGTRPARPSVLTRRRSERAGTALAGHPDADQDRPASAGGPGYVPPRLPH